MAQRVTLDSQGRLVLRETGKIILPFEHFANAVMLKHMNGPQGMHLGLEATIRAVSITYFSQIKIELHFINVHFSQGHGFIHDWTGAIWNGKRIYYRSSPELPKPCLQILQESVRTESPFSCALGRATDIYFRSPAF